MAVEGREGGHDSGDDVLVPPDRGGVPPCRGVRGRGRLGGVDGVDLETDFSWENSGWALPWMVICPADTGVGL